MHVYNAQVGTGAPVASTSQSQTLASCRRHLPDDLQPLLLCRMAHIYEDAGWAVDAAPVDEVQIQVLKCLCKQPECPHDGVQRAYADKWPHLLGASVSCFKANAGMLLLRMPTLALVLRTIVLRTCALHCSSCNIHQTTHHVQIKAAPCRASRNKCNGCQHNQGCSRHTTAKLLL